jgi:hypothetical protein
VRVNFKLRHYDDTCECCKHDICNIRWSHIRHEFDKLALRNEDRMIAMEELQDCLEGLRDDIEERRGGLPLTTKQKEDDLKAAIDAMHERHKVKAEEQAASGSLRDQKEAEAKREEKEREAKEKKRKKMERERERAEALKRGGRVADAPDPEDSSDEEEEIRIHFKDFERWYLEYFQEEDLGEEEDEADKKQLKKG